MEIIYYKPPRPSRRLPLRGGTLYYLHTANHQPLTTTCHICHYPSKIALMVFLSALCSMVATALFAQLAQAASPLSTITVTAFSQATETPSSDDGSRSVRMGLKTVRYRARVAYDGTGFNGYGRSMNLICASLHLFYDYLIPNLSFK